MSRVSKVFLYAALVTQGAAVVFLVLGPTEIVTWASTEFVKPLIGEEVDCGWESYLVSALDWVIAYSWLVAGLLPSLGGLLCVPAVVLNRSKAPIDRFAWVLAAVAVPVPTVLVYCVSELRRFARAEHS